MAKKSRLPEHVEALREASAYPEDTADVVLVQTHISYVFLLDRDVYKLKKPVDLGFADFTSLEKRKAACEAEVRLNRRGCPGNTYLGVETVRRAENGSYRIGSEGSIVDYAVHMRRLPQDRMMDVLLERGEVGFDMIGRVAARVAELHEVAERSDTITRVGGVEAQVRNWRDTLQDMRGFIGRSLTQGRFERIEAYAESFLEREKELLRRREEQGWVRDNHGDMRSDSFCFDPDVPGGVCIYDCIEFNDAFRYSDTAADVAFLAMDLDYRGRPDLSDLLIGLYGPAIGDPDLPLLLHFYKCYRACVRGKVETLLSADEGVPRPQRTEARKRAQVYFRLAESYTRRKAAAGLVVVSGPSGSGKSVLAGALSARLGGALLSTDVVRRRTFNQSDREAALGSGVYDEASRRRVYEAMLAEAASYLQQDRLVVLDGTFIERQQRGPFVALATESKRQLLVVECSAPDEVVRQRQQQRQGESWTQSEGRYEVYLDQKRRIEPADEVGVRQRVAVDTTLAIEDQIDIVSRKLRA